MEKTLFLYGIADLHSTLVYFVSPHALIASLEDACEIFGSERRCCLARELTKAHEEIWRGALGEALAEFSSRGARGEFTIVIEGFDGAKNREVDVDDAEIIDALKNAILGGLSPSQAAKGVSSTLRVPKKRAYSLAIALNDQKIPGP